MFQRAFWVCAALVNFGVMAWLAFLVVDGAITRTYMQASTETDLQACQVLVRLAGAQVAGKPVVDVVRAVAGADDNIANIESGVFLSTDVFAKLQDGTLYLNDIPFPVANGRVRGVPDGYCGDRAD